MQHLVQSINVDDLPNGDLKHLAAVLGMDAVRKLLSNCRGMSFYVPAKMTQDYYKRYIHANYNPARPNVRELALALGLTEQTIYRMLREAMPKPIALAA